MPRTIFSLYYGASDWRLDVFLITPLHFAFIHSSIYHYKTIDSEFEIEIFFYLLCHDCSPQK